MVIYLITNRLNGKVYIGQTIHSHIARWSDHKRKANHGSLFSFHQAIRKYGSDAFEIRLLGQCNTEDAEDLNFMEMFCISLYNSTNPKRGYNMAEGGQGGGKRPEQVKRKISVYQQTYWAAHRPVPTCHPDREHYAKGLCQYCYRRLDTEKLNAYKRAHHRMKRERELAAQCQ